MIASVFKKAWACPERCSTITIRAAEALVEDGKELRLHRTRGDPEVFQRQVPIEA